MRILWVKPGKLLPLDSGGKLRSYNILRHLCALAEVTFLSYYYGKRDLTYEREIREHLPGAIAIHMQEVYAPGIARHAKCFRNFLSKTPYSVVRFTSAQVKKMVTERISKGHYDVAVCDFLASSLNFPEKLPIPVVLFQHNVETLLWERRAQFEMKLLDRWAATAECSKMRRFEPAQVRRFHHVFAVSDEDRKLMCSMTDPNRITVIPTGVDLGKYRSAPSQRTCGGSVVFVGSMDWAPNVDAVEYFCQEIWPLVLLKAPNARFRIVGRNPHPRVQNLASDSVEVTGSVINVDDYLRDAAAVVVPLRMGGGTRIKVYEGMAMGKATVSTRIGCEGLDVRHEHDILLADNPQQFAAYVVNLLSDPHTRMRLEEAAAITAGKHDWSAVTKRFAEALDTLTAAADPHHEAIEPVALQG